MANNNKKYSQQQDGDTESSPLIGQQVDSCEEMFRKFREKYRFHFAGAWLLVILATATITYFVNSDKMNNTDPDTCLSDRQKKYALLLSVIFGVVGADRFYLGYPFIGALKVITGGAAGLWWVYDLVLILMNVLQDANGCRLQ